MARSGLPQFKIDDSVSEVWRWTLVLAILMVVFFGFAYRVIGLQQQSEAHTATRIENGTEDQQLFFDLIRAGLLRPAEDGGLDQVESDYLLVQRVEGNEPPEGVSRAEQGRLLSELYTSSVGVIVRQQVSLWNASRRVAAIRDNRPRSESEAATTRWQAFSDTSHPLRTGDLVPETFGFIHGQHLQAGFSNWITVPGSRSRVTFRSTITAPGEARITIHVVGNPVEVPQGARVQRLEAPEHLHRNWPCDVAPVAAVVIVPVQGPRELAVTVEPAINCVPRVFGLAIRLERAADTGAEDGEGDREVDPADENLDQDTDASGDDQTARVGVEDTGEGEAPRIASAIDGWVYRWRPVPRASATAGRFTLYTADGIALTDPSGSGDPTDAALEFGLLNLVGFGPADSSSLIGMMRRSRLPAHNLEIRLTIDSHIQRAAQASIDYWLEQWSSNRFGDERKSAVIVLDADTGALLAVANYPLPPDNARPWDYAAFAFTHPLRDPMSIFGWEVSDKHNTPGSTFKPMVALALIQSGDPTIRRLVQGVDPGTFTRLMGFGPGTGAYYPAGGRRGVPNFGGGGMSGYFSAASRHNACLEAGHAPDLRRFASGGRPPQFGVTQAVQGSFNVWFARMAVMLDQPRIESWVASLPTASGWTLRPSSPPETRLIESVRQFGIDPEERIDLAVNVPDDVGLFRINTESGADVLFSALPSSVITNVEYPRAQPPDIQSLTLFMVAQNGFGQSWSVTPLHMARATAGIASGRLVRPHIFSHWGGRELGVPDAPPLGGEPELLSLLREGMKAVAEAPRSTAGSIFGSRGEIQQWRQRNNSEATLDDLLAIRCRVYGKTGTADVSRREGYNSGWFIGWLEPAEPGARRIAFACMTTHAISAGSMNRFGGSTCGRIIRDMLLDIEADRLERVNRIEDEEEQGATDQEQEGNRRAERDLDEESEGSESGRDEGNGSGIIPDLPPEDDPGSDRPRENP